jgi:hypothetical protein
MFFRILLAFFLAAIEIAADTSSTSASIRFATGDESSGKTRAVLGTVEIQKKQSGIWKPLRVGAKLGSKDMVRTLAESQAEIEFATGGNITIEENSLVEMAKLFQDGAVNATKIDVKSGRLLFKVQKLNQARSTFEFQMGNATAAIRGTEGGILRSPGGYGAYLREGRLEVRGTGSTNTIVAGQLLLASDQGQPVKIDIAATMAKIKEQKDSAAIVAAIAEARAKLRQYVSPDDPAYAAMDRLLDEIMASLRSSVQIRKPIANPLPGDFSLQITTPSPLQVCKGSAQVQGIFHADSGSQLFLRLGGQSSPDLTMNSVGGAFAYTFNISDKAKNWNATEIVANLMGPQGDVNAVLALDVDKKCPAVNLLPPKLELDMADSVRCNYRLTVGNAEGDVLILRTMVDGAETQEETLTRDVNGQSRALMEGIHSYRFEISDLAGNKAEFVSADIGCYKPRAIGIRLEGAATEKIRIPPPPPGNTARSIVRPLRFSISLPSGYDYRFLKRVVVRKKGGNVLATWEGSTLNSDPYYSVLVDLASGIQTFEIEAVPRTGRTQIVQKTFELR